MRPPPMGLIFLFAFAAASGADPGAETPPLGPVATWFDDWYAVTRLDEQTFAIAEPRYEQHNVGYLLVGAARAVLFDTGPGVRDVGPVAASLTDRPLTAAFSHLHYDHIGGQARFARVASLDHPSIRERVGRDGLFTPALLQHAGTGRPTFRIGEWWSADAPVDLGGRVLYALSVPGHTPESLALYDAERCQLFSGDFLYPGELFAFVPGSDLAAYRDSTRRLLAATAACESLAIYGAHVESAAGSPRQSRRDLEQLASALDALLARNGEPPRWTLAWFGWIPTRRYRFDGGPVMLLPLFRLPAR